MRSRESENAARGSMERGREAQPSFQGTMVYFSELSGPADICDICNSKAVAQSVRVNGTAVFPQHFKSEG